ncbi:MAG: hypothetical protein DRJ99_03250 [Thermoplasmata archaeon]|nr:MAG: hypothetical protein DRJ99_03250 [Thermoplasmata archaeon]
MAAQYYISNISWHSEVKKGESTNITLTVDNKGTDGEGFYKITSLTAGRDFCKGGLDIAAGGRRYVRCSSTVMDQEGYERFLCQVGHWDTGHKLVVDHQRTITIHVIEEEQPPPPTPPPEENKWDLTVETSVSNATVKVSGPETATKTADADGTAVFNDLKEGTYTITASKTGYETATKTITLNRNMTVNVFPEYIPPPQVCTPGEKKCMNGNLYICNEQGSGWELYEENSPICRETGGCPDFWTDPIGAVTCWIISFIEQALHLATGGFLTLLSNIKNFLDNFSTAIADFLSDPIGHVRDYVEATWNWLSDVVGKITSVIGDWWSSTAKTVQSWISATVENIQDFIQDPINYLSNWLNTVKTIIGGWINSAIQGILDFIENFSTYVWEWWNNNIASIFETIRTAIENIQDFVENPIKYLNDWLDTVKTIIGGWISARIEDALSWVTNKFIDFIYWLSTIPGSVSDYIWEQILGVKEFVETYFVENVVNMFGWINDIQEAVKNAINFFINLYDVITGADKVAGLDTKPIDKWKEHIDKTKEILEGET